MEIIFCFVLYIGVLALVLHLLQLTPRIPVDVLLLGFSTFVVHLLATAKGDLYLYKVALQVDGGRDEGEAPFVNLTLELLYL